MNRLMPEPSPHPFWTNSSSSITTIPAAISCKNMTTITVMPKSAPYMPLRMYAPAWTAVRIMERNLLATVNKPRSSGLDISQLIKEEPARSWRINPAVTMGPIPSSIRVPRLLAKITRKAPNWSCTLEEIP